VVGSLRTEKSGSVQHKYLLVAVCLRGAAGRCTLGSCVGGNCCKHAEYAKKQKRTQHERILSHDQVWAWAWRQQEMKRAYRVHRNRVDLACTYKHVAIAKACTCSDKFSLDPWENTRLPSENTSLSSEKLPPAHTPSTPSTLACFRLPSTDVRLLLCGEAGALPCRRKGDGGRTATDKGTAA